MTNLKDDFSFHNKTKSKKLLTMKAYENRNKII